MIEAREVFINDDVRPPFDTIADVEGYAEKAFSSVHFLLLEALASANNQDVKGHARHAANQVPFYFQEEVQGGHPESYNILWEFGYVAIVRYSRPECDLFRSK